MGYVDSFDVVTALAALEFVLADLGHPVTSGQSLRAAGQILQK
jgi:aspartate aminotransferase-like enzyme